MEVTKTMVLDVAELAQSLEAGIGEYLRPEETGWYMPYDLEPTLKEGRSYFVTAENRGLIKWDLSQRPTGLDVYDQHADILVPAEQTRALQEASFPHSARIVKLIKACANHLLDTHAAWGGVYEDQHRRAIRARENGIDNYDVIRKEIEKVLDEYGLLTLANLDHQARYLSQQFNLPYEDCRTRLQEYAAHLRKLPSKDVRRDQERGGNLKGVIADFVYPQYEAEDDILSIIEDYLLDFRTTILDFLGKDKWIMFFSKISRGKLIIERTVDYRIYSWMVEHGYWDRTM